MISTEISPNHATRLNDLLLKHAEILTAIKSTDVNALARLGESFASSFMQNRMISFPAGFYDNEGFFHPVIYSIVRNENNSVKLCRWSLGAKANLEQSWEFTESAVTEEQITKMIKTLLAQLSKEESVSQSVRDRVKILSMGQVYSPTQPAATSGNNEIEVTPENYTSACLEKIFGLNASIPTEKSFGKDIWDLTDQAAGEVWSEDKIAVALHILNYEVALLKKGASKLSLEEKIRVEQEINARSKRLEKRIQAYTKADSSSMVAGFLKKQKD